MTSELLSKVSPSLLLSIYNTKRYNYSLTLGAHAQRGLQYSGWVCLCACVSVCLLSHISPTEHLFVLKTLPRTQRATKVKKFVGICLKRLGSRVMPRNMSEKANMLIIPTYRCQLSPLDTQRRARGYPTIVNNIQPCPKLCLLMPLARVGARTDSTTSYSYSAVHPNSRTCTFLHFDP